MACSTPALNRTQTDRQTDKIEHDVRAKWDTNKRVQFINNLDDDVMNRLDAQVKHLLDTDTHVTSSSGPGPPGSSVSLNLPYL